MIVKNGIALVNVFVSESLGAAIKKSARGMVFVTIEHSDEDLRALRVLGQGTELELDGGYRSFRGWHNDREWRLLMRPPAWQGPTTEMPEETKG